MGFLGRSSWGGGYSICRCRQIDREAKHQRKQDNFTGDYFYVEKYKLKCIANGRQMLWMEDNEVLVCNFCIL